MPCYGDILVYNTYKSMDLHLNEDYEKIDWLKRIKMPNKVQCTLMSNQWLFTSYGTELDVHNTLNEGQREQIIYLDRPPTTMTEITISGSKFALIGYKKYAYDLINTDDRISCKAGEGPLCRLKK